jgi:hypothetical protein
MGHHWVTRSRRSQNESRYPCPVRILCGKKGDFLYSKRDGLIRATRKDRKLATQRRCGRKFATCRTCALLDGMISKELAHGFADPQFTLPEPLSLADAQDWRAR